MRCAIYARVSTIGKGQDAENQAAQMRDWAKREGHTLVEEYIDTASGSGKVRRPAFERMLLDAKSVCPGCLGKGERAIKGGSLMGQCGSCNGTGKRWSMLLFWSLDRLSREGVLGTLQHLQKLDQAKVCWRSHTEAYLDSCGVFKDAVLAILAAIAKQERIRISERVKAGLEKAAAAGRKGGRRPVERDKGLLERVTALRLSGCSFKQIEAETGLPKSSAHRLMSGGM